MKKFKGFLKKSIAAFMTAAMVLTTPAFESSFTNSKSIVFAEDGKRISDQQISEFKEMDSYSTVFFSNLLEEKKLIYPDGDMTLEEVSDGVLVSGKNKKVKKGYITIGGMFDFGEEGAERIALDILAKRATKTYMSVYLDNETIPLSVVRVSNQKQKDKWNTSKPVIANFFGNNIKGKHFITFVIDDQTTDDDKKTQVFFKSITAYASTGIPQIDITIDESFVPIYDMNGDVDHDTECYGSIDIRVPEGYNSGYHEEGQTEYTGGHYELDYIRGRGNSTWSTEKKPYKIKLENEENLFGMGTNKHWALIANYYDNSLIRNRITYYLGERLNMEFTPQLVPVDVFMNGTYLGNYYLCEQVRIGNSRVDIGDLEEISVDETNITGGYLLGLNPYGNEEGYTFETTNGMNFVVDSPEKVSGKASVRIGEMNSYIEDYITKTEEAIFSDDFKDSDGKSYTEYLDIDSAAKYLLFQEFTMNGDAYGNTSTKLYKKKDGKLYWGPLWDFDYVAWASMDYADYDTNDTYYSGFVTTMGCPWMSQLLKDPKFYNKVLDYWGRKGTNEPGTLRYELQQLIADGGVIDQYEAELTASANQNFDKWNFTKEGYSEYDVPGNSFSCQTYHDEIERLKKWISLRIAWMDANIENIAPTEKKIEYYVDGKLIKTQKVFSDVGITEIPEAPKKAGYIFIGWGYDYECIDPETKEKDIYHDTLTAGTIVDQDIKAVAEYMAESDLIPAEKVYFLYDEIYLNTYGDEYTLRYSTVPITADTLGTHFTSSNPDVARVDQCGTVTPGEEPGDAVITVTTVNGKSAKCTVHVVYQDDLCDCYEFQVSENEVDMKVSDHKKIDILTDPANHPPLVFKILNADPDVAEMSEAGVIYAYGVGETRIIIYDTLSECFQVIKVNVTDDNNNNNNNNNGNNGNNENNKKALTVLKKGTKFVYGNYRYIVTKAGTKRGKKVVHGTVKVLGLKKNAKAKNGKALSTLKIRETLKFQNNCFKVTEINKNAFKGNKNITMVVLNKNILKVGSGAFMNCKKLAKLYVKGKKTVFGKNAYKGISKKATAYVTRTKLNVYKTLLSKVGINKTRVKKIKAVATKKTSKTTTKKTTTKKTTTKKTTTKKTASKKTTKKTK